MVGNHLCLLTTQVLPTQRLLTENCNGGHNEVTWLAYQSSTL